MVEEKTMSRRERNLADIRKRATPIAERIVLEEGVDALTARRLATAAGVSVGSLYNAYGDLEHVIMAVNARCGDMLSDCLKNALATAAPDKRSRVIALGEAYFDFAIQEPRRWWMLFEYRSDQPADERSQQVQSDLLEMLIRAGEGDPGSEMHRQFFLVLWASVHGLVSLAYRRNIQTIDPSVARGHIGALVDAGLNAFPN